MNVIDLLREKNIEPKKVGGTHGGEYQSACPGCGDFSKPDSNRFHVWPEQNNGEGSFWCRGCGKGGDVIQFLIEFEGKSFPEACAALGREVQDVPRRLTRPTRPAKRDWQPIAVVRPEGVDASLWQEKAGKFVDWSHDCLMKSPAHLKFLADRGISPKTAARFRLGWNPGENDKGAVFRPRKAWGLPKVVKDGKEKRLWVPRGMVVPYFSGDELARVRIRRPDEDLSEQFKQRYFVVPGSGMDRTLYGKGRKAYVVVETELDAMLLWQAAGDLVGCIALGTSHAKPDPVCHEALSRALCILVALDFDKAGAGAWQWWPAQYGQAERWPVPSGKDPGEAWQAGVDLRAWILAGLPPVMTVGLNAPTGKGVSGLPAPPPPAVPKKESAPEQALPPSVAELKKLIMRYPFRIEHTAGRTRLIENTTWAMKNWRISCRVSHLIFRMPDVQSFLDAHPANIITRENFNSGIKQALCKTR